MSEKEIISFIAINIVPQAIDITRLVLFQVAASLKLDAFSNAIAGSKGGYLITVLVCAVFGLILSVWYGHTELNIDSIAVNSAAILGYSQTLYKMWYEKSSVRKTIATTTDNLGPQSLQKDDRNDTLVG